MVDLCNDTGERECRQVQTQRFQHAYEDRLPAGAYQSLAGPPRLASLGWVAECSFGFVVRARHGLAGAVWLSRRLRRDKREQLSVQHESHHFVDQQTIVVRRAILQRRQLQSPLRRTQVKYLIVQTGDFLRSAHRAQAAVTLRPTCRAVNLQQMIGELAVLLRSEERRVGK